MTLSSLTNRVGYAGAGLTGPYAIPFRIFSSADVRVIRVDADGNETLLTLTTDYTIAGVGNSTSTLTLADALEAGLTLVIRRAPAMTQTADFENESAFYAKSHQDALDRIGMQLQALQDATDRSLGIRESKTPSLFSLLLAPETGKVLAWQSATELGNSTLDSSAVALPGNGRTVATLSAFLLNNFGRVFHASDYGVVADGATNDAPALNACVAACVAAGGGAVQLPAGTLRLTAPINLTSAGATPSQAVTIRGMGRRSTLLSIVHTGHGIDCTGTGFLSFEDFSVSGNGVTVPKTAFLLARNSTAGSAAWNQFRRITTTGSFSVACVYNYASEDMRDSHSTFSNDAAAGKCVYITGSNKALQTSSFVTICGNGAPSAQSCTDHRLNGTELWNSGSGNADCLYLESCRSVTWRDAFSTMTNSGRSHAYVDATTQPTSDITIADIFWDGATAKFGLAFEGASALSRIRVTGVSNAGVRALDAGTVKLSTVGFAIYVPDASVITGLVWKQNGGTNSLRLYETYEAEIECNSADLFYAKYVFWNNRVRVTKANFVLDRTDSIGCRIHYLNDGSSSENRSVSEAYDPPNLIAGAQTTRDIVCLGVVVGMTVDVGVPYDLQGIMYTAIAMADQIRLTLYNPTAGALNLGTGTWYYQARKI